MKTRTEFIIWVSLGEKVTEGDTERLVETAKEYVKFAGGKPDLNAYLTEDDLALLIAATDEPVKIERDGKYLRAGIRKALEEAGLALPGDRAAAPGTLTCESPRPRSSITSCCTTR